MKLSDLLVALSCNRNLIIALSNGTKSMEVFEAKNYKFVVDDYGDEIVGKIKITSPTTATITLAGDEEEIED